MLSCTPTLPPPTSPPLPRHNSCKCVEKFCLRGTYLLTWGGVAGDQAVLQIYWTTFLAVVAHMPVRLVRGMKRPWRTNYSEDTGGVTQTATNNPVRSGFSFPRTVCRVISVKRKSSLAQKVQLGGCWPCCVPATPRRWSDTPGSCPWHICSQLPGIYLCIPCFPFLLHSTRGPLSAWSLSWLSIGYTTASSVLLTQVARGQRFSMKRF